MSELIDSYMIGGNRLQFQVYQFDCGYTFVSKEVFPYTLHEDQTYEFYGLGITENEGRQVSSTLGGIISMNNRLVTLGNKVETEQYLYGLIENPEALDFYDSIIDMDDYSEAVVVPCNEFEVILYRRYDIVGRFVIRDSEVGLSFDMDGVRLASPGCLQTSSTIGISSRSDGYPHSSYTYDTEGEASKAFKKFHNLLLEGKRRVSDE